MNPFELYDIDPSDGPSAITARMREHIEAAETDEEREGIRAAWEALTLDPRRRLVLALAAHPESRPPLGRPPRPVRRPLPSAELELADLITFPSVQAAIGLSPSDPLELPDVPVTDDPLLKLR